MHDLDHANNSQNRYMTFEAWMQLLLDVGIVAKPVKITPAQQAAAAAAKERFVRCNPHGVRILLGGWFTDIGWMHSWCRRHSAARLAHKHASSPQARSRSFAASMSGLTRNGKRIADHFKMKPGDASVASEGSEQPAVETVRHSRRFFANTV